MPGWDPNPQIHNAAGLEKMRAACTLAARVLEHAGSLVKPGVRTEEIDAAVHAMTIEAGAYPSPLNYGNFPKSVCTSVNEVICHGIPDSRQLQEGDIINIDVTVFLNVSRGWVEGDAYRHVCLCVMVASFFFFKLFQPIFIFLQSRRSRLGRVHVCVSGFLCNAVVPPPSSSILHPLILRFMR